MNRKLFGLSLGLFLSIVLMNNSNPQVGGGGISAGISSYTQLPTIPSGTVLGNSSGSTAAPSALSSPTISGTLTAAGYGLSGGDWAALTNGAPIFQNTIFSGSTTNAGQAFGAFLQQTDNSSATSGSNGYAPGFLEHLILNGSSVIGGRVAGSFILDINATTGNSTAQDYVGMIVACDLGATDASFGGSSCFGINPIAHIKTGVAAVSLVSQETDTWSETTSISVSTVAITGTAGQFSCTCSGLAAGQKLTISGVYGGTGSIIGYSNPTIYYVSTTDGISTFTLQTIAQTAIVTTAGTPTGLTYTAYEILDRVGYQIVDVTGSTYGQQAARTDVALSLGNQYGPGANLGFKVGLTFGSVGAFPPVATNGTLIYGTGNVGAGFTVANGIDWHLGTFTNLSWNDGINTMGPAGITSANFNGTSAGATMVFGTSATTKNGVEIIPAATGVKATIQGVGVDATQSLQIYAAGTGNIFLGNGTDGISFKVTDCGGACINVLSTNGTTPGNTPQIINQAGDTNGIGLGINIQGRNASVNGSGGPLSLTAGNGFGTAGNGGVINIKGGNGGATSGNGGNITFTPGTVTSGTAGVNILNAGVQMPNLALSSAATTGTVCWTTVTGNLTVDTTTTCLASDGRLKKNVDPLDVGLNEVMKLKPVSYELKSDPTHIGRQVGLIAQDVIKVDPRLASVYQSGPDEGTPSGVRYEQMVALLVKAIQEQQQEIDQLKREIKWRHH
jgi:hypothetical protein